MAWGCMDLWHVDDQQCTLKSCIENPMRMLVPLNIDGYLMNTIKMLFVFFFFHIIFELKALVKKELDFQNMKLKGEFCLEKKEKD